jgi:AraC family transcriptional regulator
MLLAGRAGDNSCSESHEQPALTVVFHPTTEPSANEIGPGGVVGFARELTPAWLERYELTAKDLGGYRFLGPSVWSRLASARLLGTAFGPGPGAEADLEAQALELLEPLIKSFPAPPPRPIPRWLRRAAEFLDGQFRSPISLRAAALEAGVHLEYLARVFHRHHGCSVSAYLRALCLADAVVLHQDGSLAVAAYKADFADQAHLSRCFRQTFGFPPKTLRRS